MLSATSSQCTTLEDVRTFFSQAEPEVAEMAALIRRVIERADPQERKLAA